MTITQEQADLAATLRGLLDRQSGSAQVRAALDAPHGYDEKLWSVLCEQIGVAALAVPEEFGGVGAGLREVQIVAEELGRTLTPSPFLGSAVLATYAILASADTDACGRLLPGLADGSHLAALAWTGSDGHWSTVVTPIAAHDNALTGTAHYVLGGDHATILLVVAHVDDEVGLFEVDPTHPGVRRTHTPTMDPTRRLAIVELDAVPATRLGGDFRSGLASVRDTACAVLAAEQVGAAAHALAITVEYSKNRHQFGRPIGGFQALKHRMADLHTLVESARSAAEYAGEDLTERSALVAKVTCSQTFSAVAADMIQLHGGIAITWEHDAHLYFKHAHSTSHLFAPPHHHLTRLNLRTA